MKFKKTKKEFIIKYGILDKPIKEQLKEQDFRIDEATQKEIESFEESKLAAQRLLTRGYLKADEFVKIINRLKI